MTTPDSTPNTVTIQLTKGYLCIVGLEDGDLADYKWVGYEGWTSGPYAHRNGGVGKGSRPVAMHRVIMERMLGRELVKGETVDHINRNGLDNRRENLRLADHSSNAQNSKRRRDNSSGYKGVCWSKPANRWRAYGKIDGKQKHLGYFDTAAQAYKAYCEFAKEHYGEFARLE